MDMIAVISILISSGSSTLSGTQRNKIPQSCLTLCNPMGCSPPGSSVHGDSPGKNPGVGCHALLQGIIPTQGLNTDLPYCRQVPYHLSHQGSPWILEWVAYPFLQGNFPIQKSNWSLLHCRWILCQLSWILYIKDKVYNYLHKELAQNCSKNVNKLFCEVETMANKC